MTEAIQAYPLQWPAGWRRTPAEQRKRAKFGEKKAVYRDDAVKGPLPAPESWWQVLGFKSPDVSREDIKQQHRRLISEHHPDAGGDTDMAARINRARDQGLDAL